MPRLRPVPEKPLQEEKPELFGEKDEPVKQPDGEVTKVEAKTEPEKPAPPEQTDEDKLALQKQVEALKTAADLQRRELEETKLRTEQLSRDRDEALRKAADRDKEILQSQSNEIAAALEAAESKAQKALADLEAAESAGDVKAKWEAQRRLNRADNEIAKYEEAKEQIEKQAKEPPAPIRASDPVEEIISNTPIPESGRSYLRQHKDIITDPKKNNATKYWHDQADAQKIPLWTQEYFDFLDEKLGHRAPREPAAERQNNGGSIVSAPVTREIASTGTGQRTSSRVTLSAEQREAARVAGITEAEYAKQVQRLMEAKANGQYTGGQ